MKALYFEEHGTSENLRYGDLEQPTIASDEVLLRVRACALNQLDLWVLKGWGGLRLPMPHIGGSDIAGEIVEVGSEVADWKSGQRVVVSPGYLEPGEDDEWTLRGEDSLSPRYRIFGEQRAGGFAEFVSVPASTLVEMPRGLDFPEACAPLLVGTTAWRMLKTKGELSKGQSVLIVGAGGGLNSFCVQLANFMGGRVIALSSSEEKLGRARELGAEDVINYRTSPNWDREVRALTDGRGVDLVVDNVGEETFARSLSSLARGGRLLTVGNSSGPQVSFDNRLVFARQLSILGSTMGSQEDFRQVLSLIWAGKVSPVIDRTIPLAEGRSGYEFLRRGEQFGKIILIP